METYGTATKGLESKMKVVAVISGGLDSISYMSKFVKNGDEITAITFDYGQKAKNEMFRAEEICNELKIPIQRIILPIGTLWKDTQLCGDLKIEAQYSKSVVVPLRNGVMLMIALAYAYSIKADIVISGSHKGDTTLIECGNHKEYSYPDCSPIFTRNLQDAVRHGVFACDNPVRILNPAIEDMTKDDLIKLGRQNLGDLIFRTWSCYQTGIEQCGNCESCNNRKEAFRRVGVEDKTKYGT